MRNSKNRFRVAVLSISAIALLCVVGVFVFTFKTDKKVTSDSYISEDYTTGNNAKNRYLLKESDEVEENGVKQAQYADEYTLPVPRKPEATSTPYPLPDFNEGDDDVYDEDKTYEIEEVITGNLNIILDMDYNTDVDDVCALRMAAMLDKEGKIDLKAVVASTTGTDVLRAMHAQLSYDGYGNIPIGRSSGETHSGSPYWADLIKNYYNESNFSIYPALSLYKQVLRNAEQNKSTVRIITTGYLVNVANALKDSECFELINNNVDYIYITGGEWERGRDYNFTYTQEAADSIAYVVANSPVPLVFSSYLSIRENSEYLMCGDTVMQLDPSEKDPITIAFRAYERANNASLSAGRFAWDPFCVWAACLSNAETNTFLFPCHIWIGANGDNEFTTTGAQSCYVIKRESPELGWYKNQLNTWLNKGVK